MARALSIPRDTVKCGGMHLQLHFETATALSWNSHVFAKLMTLIPNGGDLLHRYIELKLGGTSRAIAA